MKYITGIHALNLPCPLETSGDWHTSALRWENITFAESKEMFFGSYGINYGVKIPEHKETYAVADHIRALLDLLELGHFTAAQGMNKDFICNPAYDEEIFGKVYSMRVLDNWEDINLFMEKEYFMQWVRFREGREQEAGDWKKSQLSDMGGSCTERGYGDGIERDTDAQKRFSNNDRNVEKILPIENACKGKNIDECNCTCINDLRAYNIDDLALRKGAAYQYGNRLKDLYDVCYICGHYLDDLSPYVLEQLKINMGINGIRQCEYVINTQEDDSVDKNRLVRDYLAVYDKLGLLMDEEERAIIAQMRCRYGIVDG